MEKIESLKTATSRFRDYLDRNKLRKTPERFAILEAVYSSDGMFTTDELLSLLVSDRHFVVSRATVYNTVNVLVDAGLAVRHRVGNKTRYERVSGTGSSHFYMICDNCGSIREFHNEKLLTALSFIHLGKFSAESMTLYVHGLCTKCSNALKRRQKKLLKQK